MVNNTNSSSDLSISCAEPCNARPFVSEYVGNITYLKSSIDTADE